MPITVQVDLYILKEKILKLKKEIYNQQMELLDYKNFFKIENNNDIKNMIQEIETNEKILNKKIKIYKMYNI